MSCRGLTRHLYSDKKDSSTTVGMTYYTPQQIYLNTRNVLKLTPFQILKLFILFSEQFCNIIAIGIQQQCQ